MSEPIDETMLKAEHMLKSLMRSEYHRGYLAGLAVAEKNLGWLIGPNVSKRIKMIYTWSAKSIEEGKESIERIK